MKIAVYTCITDSYAPLVAPAVVADGVDYLCFSDGTMDDVEPWQFKPLKPFFANPIRNARLPKILSHRYLAEYDFTIWLDASLQLTCDPRRLVEFLERSYCVAAFVNSRRKDLLDEFEAIRQSKWARKGRVNLNLLDEQQARYTTTPHGLLSRGMERLPDSPVYYGGMIVRRTCEATRWFEEEWFSEYCLWQHRDIPSMIHSCNCPIKTIPGDIKNNEFTKWVK